MKRQILSTNEIFSEFQIREDKILYQYFKQKNELEELGKEVDILSHAQDFCSFNVFFVFGISPVFIRLKTFEFIAENHSQLKRKLTLKEVAALDFNIHDLQPTDFNNLKEKLKNDGTVL